MSNLDLVDTIVFLMMENRSFDHMLGHLSLTGRMPDVDGLQAPLDHGRYGNPHDGRIFHPFMMRDVRLESDVPHNREHLPTQLAWSDDLDAYLRGPIGVDLLDALR